MPIKVNYTHTLLTSEKLLIQPGIVVLFLKFIKNKMGGKFYDLIKSLYTKSKMNILNIKRACDKLAFFLHYFSIYT